MAILDLLNQQEEKDVIQPKINRLNQLMQLRKPFWNKASFEQRKQWLLSDKDPVLKLAWVIYKYLDNNFFGEKYYDKGEL